MDVLQTAREKEAGLEGSKYRIRRAYLEAMKEFMANTLKPAPVQPNDERSKNSIEEYLIYEKQLSYHLQELLEHSKT